MNEKRPMSKAPQLVECVPVRYNHLTSFHCFGENFEFTSRFSNCPMSENTTESERQVSCDLLVSWANILCSSYKNRETLEPLD